MKQTWKDRTTGYGPGAAMGAVCLVAGVLVSVGLLTWARLLLLFAGLFAVGLYFTRGLWAFPADAARDDPARFFV